MAKKLYNETYIENIASAIREKTSSSDTFKVSEMSDAIMAIPEGGADLSEYFETSPTSLPQSSDSFAVTQLLKKVPDIVLPNSLENVGYMFSNWAYDYLPKITFGNHITNMRNMLASCTNLPSISLPYIDTTNVTDMSYLFSSCSKATTIDVSNFDTKKVTTMASMFYSCASLTEIDLSNFETPALTNVNQMFYSCRALKKIDLSSFNISKCTSVSGGYHMLWNCQLLEEAIMPETMSFTTSYNLRACFENCYSLKKVVLKAQGVVKYNDTLKNCYHFTGTVNNTYNPDGLKDGFIYVPDAYVDDYKTDTGWINFASQIKGMSELES